jgi:putative tricarboxylic transport membrane protein
VLPGIGASTSNIIAYVTAKNQSKTPEEFGKGSIEGLMASESANNAGIGGALIPLMTLGIPGDSVTAMLLGGFMIHGLRPGPLLFVNSGKIVYGIFTALIIANFMMLFMQYYGIKVFTRLLSIPRHILLPFVFVLCVVGAFGANNRVFDVYTLLGFGILGIVLNGLKFPLPPLVLGFILGPIVETNLRRGLALGEGSFSLFITKPISAVFLAVAVISIILSAYKRIKQGGLFDSSDD